jgi:hypothetical protein
MSNSNESRTRNFPCGWVIEGTVNNVNIRTRLHQKKCQVCNEVQFNKGNFNHIYRYDVTKYGNIKLNKLSP